MFRFPILAPALDTQSNSLLQLFCQPYGRHTGYFPVLRTHHPIQKADLKTDGTVTRPLGTVVQKKDDEGGGG